jgi:RecJ-like exonuclease
MRRYSLRAYIPSGDIARLWDRLGNCATFGGMKAAEVAEHEVCPSCRGRGWKYSGPRRWVASQLVRGMSDSAIRIVCLDCAGTGLAEAQ